MLISYPYLPARDANESEDAYESKIFGLIQAHGAYPTSADLRWHGGCHLFAPATVPEPVRAIADGEVVAYRRAAAPATYTVPGQNVIDEFDSSFVLLKHQTETSEGVRVVFYSLYMHLMNEADLVKIKGVPRIAEAVRAATGESVVKPAVGTKIWRKDVLGFAGTMYRTQGQPASGTSLVHFEVFCTDDDLAAFWSDSRQSVETAGRNGRQGLWGASYFIIPPDTEFKSGHPNAGMPPNKPNEVNGMAFAPLSAGRNDRKLYVEVRHEHGDRITTVWAEQPDGSLQRLSNSAQERASGFEYGLYERASQLYPDNPGAGYELLRHGRIVGPDTLITDQQASWQAVTFATGQQGYVDLSAPAVLKLSDADFPHFKGWLKVDESSGAFSSDGIGDARTLLSLMQQADANHDGKISEAEWQAWARGSGADQVRRLVCRFPTEWDGADNDQRFARLKQHGQVFYNDPTGYQAFIEHLKPLQFWSHTGLPTQVWHFHPMEFVRHFKKCGWLSESEMRQLIPTSALRQSKGKWVEEPVREKDALATIKRYRVELNKACQKFGITTPQRMAAFYANATQETQWFSKLHEENSQAKYAPWDGRGFLQLTWPDNYIKYWRFRGRHVPKSLSDALGNAAKQVNQQGSNAALQDANFKELTAEMKQWRDLVNTRDIDAALSSGTYWAWTNAAKFADQPTRLDRKTVMVGNAPKVYYRSESFGQVAATVNFGSPCKNLASIDKVNGIVARFQSYSNALVVLDDKPRFVDKDNNVSDKPEGYVPRMPT